MDEFKVSGNIEIALAHSTTEKEIERLVRLQHQELERLELFEDVAPDLVAESKQRITDVINRIKSGQNETGTFTLVSFANCFCWEIFWAERGLQEIHHFTPAYSDFFAQHTAGFFLMDKIVKRTHHLCEAPFIDFPWLLQIDKLKSLFSESAYIEDTLRLSGAIASDQPWPQFPNCDEIEYGFDVRERVKSLVTYRIVLAEGTDEVIGRFKAKTMNFMCTEDIAFPKEVETTVDSLTDNAVYKTYRVIMDVTSLKPATISDYQQMTMLPKGLTVSDYRFWNGQPTQYSFDTPPTDRQFYRMAQRFRQAKAQANGCSCLDDIDLLPSQNFDQDNFTN